jgi:hypothetical protein
VFEYATQDSLRKHAFTTVLRAGAHHNRYLVADQVRELLWGIADHRSAKLAASVIRREPAAIWYVHRQLFRQPPRRGESGLRLPLSSRGHDIPF